MQMQGVTMSVCIVTGYYYFVQRAHIRWLLYSTVKGIEPNGWVMWCDHTLSSHVILMTSLWNQAMRQVLLHGVMVVFWEEDYGVYCVGQK